MAGRPPARRTIVDPNEAVGQLMRNEVFKFSSLLPDTRRRLIRIELVHMSQMSSTLWLHYPQHQCRWKVMGMSNMQCKEVS